MTSSEVLFRRQGVAATGLQQIASASAARMGSIYHFFPDGKDQLAEAVIQAGGRRYGQVVAALLTAASDDPVIALGVVFDQAADDLAASDYADACPIATIALEVASTNERLRIATAEVFATWLDALTQFCGRIVADPVGARDLATTVLAALEGAFVLARAAHDAEPVRAAGRTVVRLATQLRSGGSATSAGPAEYARPADRH